MRRCGGGDTAVTRAGEIRPIHDAVIPMPAIRHDDSDGFAFDPLRAGDDDATRGKAARTLVLRLWQEARAEAADSPLWRGTVSDLRGRQLGSFSSAAELVGILGEMPEFDVLLHISHGDPRRPATGERPHASH